MKKISKEQKLNILLEVRDMLNKKCPPFPIPSVSCSIKGESCLKHYTKSTVFNLGHNDGIHKSLYVVMDMIKEIADFVSVCCGAETKMRSEKTEIRKNGYSAKSFSECNKCKKECKCEWRIKKV